MKIVRWIAVLPTAILSFWLVWWLNTRFVGESFLWSTPGTSSFFVEVFASIVGIFAGCFAARSIAPSHKDETGLVVALIFTLLCIISIVYCFKLGFKSHIQPFISDIAMVVASIYSALLFWRDIKDNRNSSLSRPSA